MLKSVFLIAFGIGLAGCVTPTAQTTATKAATPTTILTPISAMPKGTAVYKGTISRNFTLNDETVGINRFTKGTEVDSADLTLSANFTARTTSAVSTNAKIVSTYTLEKIGQTSPTVFVDVVDYSGSAGGSGVIGTDSTGIYFNSGLSGIFTATSATRNGAPTLISNVVSSPSFTLNQPVSGYFTGANATGLYGTQTTVTGDTTAGAASSYVDTVTATKQ